MPKYDSDHDGWRPVSVDELGFLSDYDPRTKTLALENRKIEYVLVKLEPKDKADARLRQEARDAHLERNVIKPPAPTSPTVPEYNFNNADDVIRWAYEEQQRREREGK